MFRKTSFGYAHPDRFVEIIRIGHFARKVDVFIQCGIVRIYVHILFSHLAKIIILYRCDLYSDRRIIVNCIDPHGVR